MKPEDLKELAEGMGLEHVQLCEGFMCDDGEFNVAFGDEYIGDADLFQPHEDKAQAFEVLEWMDLNHIIFEGLDSVGSLLWKNDGMTLQEAITLAAIALLRSEK